MGALVSSANASSEDTTKQSMEAQRRAMEAQYLTDGNYEVSRLRCDASVSIVEEHILLMQETARERMRKSRNKSTNQQTFMDLDISSIVDEEACDYRDASFQRTSKLVRKK